ncbi:hypothetical protein [Alcaligenes sp. PF14]|uniref:hypothetical protein n=1 Tax=Alcaligenes sp. PF14 TaxID=3120297 RepID=UPI00301B0647
MTNIPTRRFKKLHEQILLSRILFFLIGWLFAVILPAVLYWNIDVLFRPNAGQYVGLLTSTIAFWSANFSLKHWLMPFPGGAVCRLGYNSGFYYLSGCVFYYAISQSRSFAGFVVNVSRLGHVIFLV